MADRGQGQRAKDSAMAASLLKKGIWHGRRLTRPYPNSGGLTMVNAPGSSKNQRRMNVRTR